MDHNEHDHLGKGIKISTGGINAWWDQLGRGRHSADQVSIEKKERAANSVAETRQRSKARNRAGDGKWEEEIWITLKRRVSNPSG